MEGGLARGVLGVYKGGGWVKKDQKRAYIICTQPQRAANIVIYRRKGMERFQTLIYIYSIGKALFKKGST